MILYISVDSVVTSFSLLILLIWVIYLFSWWIWLKVYQFCLSFQRTHFSFHRSLQLFCLSFIYFYSDLYFLPSKCGLLLIIFSSCFFRCRSLIWDFSYLSKMSVLLWSSLMTLLLHPIDFDMLYICVHMSLCIKFLWPIVVQ